MCTCGYRLYDLITRCTGSFTLLCQTIPTDHPLLPCACQLPFVSQSHVYLPETGLEGSPGVLQAPLRRTQRQARNRPSCAPGHRRDEAGCPWASTSAVCKILLLCLPKTGMKGLHRRNLGSPRGRRRPRGGTAQCDSLLEPRLEWGAGEYQGRVARSMLQVRVRRVPPLLRTWDL